MTRTTVMVATLTAVVAAVSLVDAQRGQRGRGGGAPQPPPGPPPLERLEMPAGFTMALFADGVSGARSLAQGANGTIFVGSRANQGSVHAVIDRDGDGTADDVKVLFSGLRQPNGLAVRNGALYVAEATRITRYDDIESHLDAPPDPVVVYDDLPPARSHSWKYLRFGPDDLMYVTVGAPCNICEDEIIADERFASIVRMKPDGTDVEVFAHGVRNSVGFDWHPVTGDLWFTDNGRDSLGDDVPNDELNVATSAGQHFGFPYCHQGDVADPDFGSKRPCSDFVPPVQFMGPHVAAIGMRFYTGSMFPAEYRNAAIIAQHGSWNRSEPIGYRLMVAKTDGREVSSFEPLVTGFLMGIRGTPSETRATGDAFARPVDVLQLSDGSLLMSDDQAGRLYRLSYAGR